MEALDEKYDLVVACGGDGTVDDVAAALMGSDGVMVIMPLGRANNVARMLHVPFDLEGAARQIEVARASTDGAVSYNPWRSSLIPHPSLLIARPGTVYA
jgi:diacylglycerol kinase family enzyme